MSSSASQYPPLVPLPRMVPIRQHFAPTPPVDIAATLRSEFARLTQAVKPGASIAIAVGSRGISNLRQIIATVIELLRGAGARPFIVPAMGSHGGATPEGQAGLLAEYGISEETLGVPVHASLEVERIGRTEDGVEVVCSREALGADGIVVVNRIKPHTDFAGDLGSGVMKMIVIGLGKRAGAANYHVASSRFGYEHVLRTIARVALSRAPILGGVAIVENQFHLTARLAVLPRSEIEAGEEKLFREAHALMPRLPLDEVDLLIIDRIGKNISGAGMDPNIIGRPVHGYSSLLGRQGRPVPFVRRIFVRELTPETHGNGIGIGLADFTTTRLVQSLDLDVLYINSLTSLTPNGAKIPIYFDADRLAISRALGSVALPDTARAKVIRIADTLSLERMEVSEACLEELRLNPNIAPLGAPAEMRFDAAGNLASPVGQH